LFLTVVVAERFLSCVPGWAYKDGRPYMELSETDLTSSASLPVQLQFYHVSICAISSCKR
jgi:hypothetical protein